MLERFRDSWRRYGLLPTLARASNALVRRFYFRETCVIFVVDIPKNLDASTPENVVEITDAFFQEHSNEWSESEKTLFAKFLANEDDGIVYLKDGKAAAYAWTQTKGSYVFGKFGRMTVPTNSVVFKNLFVYPEYRGQGLAGIMDRARLERHKGARGMAFILPENRYAVRNWVKKGMKLVGKATVSRWFKRVPTVKYVAVDAIGETLRPYLGIGEAPK